MEHYKSMRIQFCSQWQPHLWPGLASVVLLGSLGATHLVRVQGKLLCEPYLAERRGAHPLE